MHQALSLVRNCKPGSSYGSILLLLLLGSAPTPALAQTCPAPGTNLPPATISPVLPSDVDIPTDFPSDCNPIAFFDDFSWKSFIAMVWPVLEGQRGAPDPSQSIGPGKQGTPTPLVFETLKADWGVFQPSPDGKTPPPAPSAWESYAGTNPCSAIGVTDIGFGDVVLASFSKFGNLGEAGFGSLVGPLPTANGTYTRYFTAFNETEFQQILKENLYLRSNIPASGLTFQDGALDIKAAWIDMANVPNPERYHTRTAWVMNPFSTPNPTCNEITVGLVGLHIVQKTPSREQWIWSTFEQIDNVPRPGPFSYNKNDGTAMPGSNPNSWPPSENPTLFNVQRLVPDAGANPDGINQSTIATNKQYQLALLAKGGPWQYYQLVMTQWPLNGTGTDGSPDNTFPGTAAGAPSVWANVALETFDQKRVQTGCMACHNFMFNSPQPTDFLWSLQLNAWPSTLSAPSSSKLARVSSPPAELPDPLAALKEFMESGAAP
jgi:hypothetical protein